MNLSSEQLHDLGVDLNNLSVRLIELDERITEDNYEAHHTPHGDRVLSATATTTGLTIQAGYDPNWYPKGVKVSDTELAAVPLAAHDFHGEWNYTITAQSNAA